MVAQTRGGGSTTTNTANSPARLQFKDKLSTKNQSTDVLLKKLQNLRQELSQMEQERVDVKSLANIRKELIHSPLLLHKDKGVKAFVACCLADILRLFAPDAPYTAEELRDIFQFFFRQLATGLKGASYSYYNDYFQLLESLATVKSVVLVCDLPHADELMTEIFNTLFTLVRNDLPRNAELCMSEVLVALIDECQTLPHSVVEILMSQFQIQETRMDQPGYRLAVEVCNATSDKLQRYVCQYFTDLVVQHSKEEDFKESRAAHDLVKQINRDCPSLLYNVVPQLEEELKVDAVEIRILATQALGEMFGDKGGVILTKKYPHVWASWQAKKHDKSAIVRMAFVDACKNIIMSHPELREVVEEGLKAKFYDTDDKVRAATCKLYSQLDYETAFHHVSEEQWHQLAERCRDKKPEVSHEAMTALGRLYSLARPEMESDEEAAIKKFYWIPQAILHAATGVALRALVEESLAKYILPLPSKDEDEMAWADRLLTIMRYLDEKAIVTLRGLSNVILARPSIFERYISICEAYNGGVMDENEEKVTRNLQMVIQILSGQLSDQSKASNHLHAFAKLNETRLYKLLRTCLDVQTDIKSLAKSANEFLRRVEQVSPTILETMATFLRKSSLWIFNTSSIPNFIKYLQQPVSTGGNEAIDWEEFARCSKVATEFISKRCPVLYKRHVHDLSRALTQDSNSRLVEMALQALASMHWEPSDKRSVDRIVEFARSPNPRHSKFAVRIIGQMKEKKKVANELVDTIADLLPNAAEEDLVGLMAALGQLAIHIPEAFERQSEVIIRFVVHNILLRPTSFDDGMEVDEEWCPDSDVSSLGQAKLLGIKICRNRCLAHGNVESAREIGTPVIQMLFTLLTNGGSMTDDNADDTKIKSRIRLLAATSLLQMSSVRVFADVIMTNYVALAITTQDPCYQVRMGFITKLTACLARRKVDSRFNAVVFLTAHDPEREVRDKTTAYVSRMAHTKTHPDNRSIEIEMTILRLIHLLAHHPDFSREENNLKDTARYIASYLDNVATQENISLLYHLAMKGKSVRDGVEESSENLYCVSELAQEIIKNRAKQHTWQLTTYPGKTKLSTDIFKAMPNVEIAKKVLRTVYLPTEALKWLPELGKTAGSPNAKVRGRGATGAKERRKRKSPLSRAGVPPKKPQKKKRRKTYEDDDNDEETSGIESISDPEENDDSKEESALSDSENDANGQEGDQLGRGARGRAKKRAKREAKRQKK